MSLGDIPSILLFMLRAKMRPLGVPFAMSLFVIGDLVRCPELSSASGSGRQANRSFLLRLEGRDGRIVAPVARSHATVRAPRECVCMSF